MLVVNLQTTEQKTTKMPPNFELNFVIIENVFLFIPSFLSMLFLDFVVNNYSPSSTQPRLASS